jgi:hypothetical protein
VVEEEERRGWKITRLVGRVDKLFHMLPPKYEGRVCLSLLTKHSDCLDEAEIPVPLKY